MVPHSLQQSRIGRLSIDSVSPACIEFKHVIGFGSQRKQNLNPMTMQIAFQKHVSEMTTELAGFF